MSDLIERLEKATAENEHVAIYDALVFAHKAGWLSDGPYDVAMRWRNEGAYLCAAMTLVPEGYRVDQIGEWEAMPLRARGPWYAILKRVGSAAGTISTDRADHFPSAALALCAAALKAQESSNV